MQHLVPCICVCAYFCACISRPMGGSAHNAQHPVLCLFLMYILICLCVVWSSNWRQLRFCALNSQPPPYTYTNGITRSAARTANVFGSGTPVWVAESGLVFLTSLFPKYRTPKQSRASTSGTPGRVPEGVAGGAWGPIFRAAGGAWGVARGAGGIRAAKKVCGGLWVAAVGPGKQAGAKLGSRSAIDFRLEKAY